MRLLGLAIPLLAAGCAYQPGSFQYGKGIDGIFLGQRATVGCLDIAIQRRVDHEAKPVLAYRLGNRCNRAVEVDLLHVAVVGHTTDGREVALAPYDPRGEVRPALLDGRLVASEALAYTARGPVDRICVDAASILRAQPARWLCFGGATGEGVL